MPRRNPPRPRRRSPERDTFARIETLARNLWWTWNPDPQRLFAALDPVQWEATNHNPIRTLAALTPERRADLQQDAVFLKLVADCEAQLSRYLRARTWFQRSAKPKQKRVRVAYFCAEFGLHECLPQYAGGLGVLAGDHLKSASDLGIPLVGVGLLYRCGYYRQQLRPDGTTNAVFAWHDFTDWPIEDTGLTTAVPIGRRFVHAKIWRAQVGRVPLYLLDTDVPTNRPRDRKITDRLYGGDQETRIQQEIVLGIGGVRALQTLGIRATVFHLNEGHAAFCTVERLRQLRAAGRSLSAAMRRVRATTVFTTHTPVAAGHDRFPPALLWRHLRPLADPMGVARSELLALGRENARDAKEPFCMTVLALRLSDRRNGVAELHGDTSRRMWTRVFNTTSPAAVPIGHVTNGIHTATWLAPEMRRLYDRYLKPRWVGAAPGDDCWRHVDRIPAAELWTARTQLRRRLVHFIRQRLMEQIQRRCEPTHELTAALETFSEEALTIGFARRFATYKRAPLIFHDAKRLAALLNDLQRPVQIVFAGKAHPADAEGQAFARQIYRRARQAGFRGRVVLLEDYDMHVGRMLTSGCDVWLNNPLRPQEASGTSGMKPPLHGGLNCSILDGWWPEAFNGRNGWSIGDAQSPVGGRGQDRRDAEAIYGLLEEDIVPLFYDRDRHGVPRGWVRRMTAAMKTICGQFNTHRMLAEYLELYAPSA